MRCSDKSVLWIIFDCMRQRKLKAETRLALYYSSVSKGTLAKVSPVRVTWHLGFYVRSDREFLHHPITKVAITVNFPMANYKHIAHDLLSQAHPPSLAASIFVDRVLHKPLHLRPTSPDPTSQDARAKRRIQRLRKKEKSQRRRKVKPLSAKEKRDSGIYEIPDTAKKYEIYVPLHQMWVGYMWEILGLKTDEKAFVTGKSAGSMLTSADYHGAEVTVVRSRCMGLVGLAGIVVRDTKFTFQIITKKNELKSKSR